MAFPRYIGTLILTDTSQEADEINRPYEDDRSSYREVYALRYGSHTIGRRYLNVEFRYTGVRNSKYEMYEVAGGLCKRIPQGLIEDK